MPVSDNRRRTASGGRRPSRRDALRLLAAGAAAAPALPPWAAAQDAGGPDEPAGALDRARLDRAVERARSFDQLHGLVIAHAGEVVFAESLRGPPVDRPVNVKSVSKSIVAALAGAALDRGILSGVDQRFAEVAPDLVPGDADPRVGDLTIAHLLTMQAGLERTSGPNYGRWVQSRNWVEFALTRDFVTEPGARMFYSTGSYHLLGAALARASDRSLLDLARDWLGEPLGIAIPPWTRDPQGFYLGGNNMALSPLAMLRFGEMHRRGGVFDGTRVLSETWIASAWTPRTRSPFSGADYGYGWFLARSGGHTIAFARGYGGQMLYVVPSLALTVAITSDPTRPARTSGYAGDLHDLLARDIMPAAA